MKHLIGIDGGGTHSRLLGTDLNGAEIARLRGRSTNLESNSVETVEANLRSLLDKFWKNNAPFSVVARLKPQSKARMSS